ncbi:MAG TPA: TOBE domain-containing protein [Chitinophagales bacterium]|nr:TOBE domain-containing protein [Chitinophagales bacterium]
MTLGNRIAVLNKGRLMQLDTPMHLYNHPANKFVAGFIGSPTMNFLKGVIERKDGYCFVHESNSCRIQLPSLPSSLESYIDKSLIAGIRPEHIVLLEGENSSNAPDATLSVSAYENMGSEQLVYLSLGNQTLIAGRPPNESVEIGKETAVHFLRNRIVFIDEETGEVVG